MIDSRGHDQRGSLWEGMGGASLGRGGAEWCIVVDGRTEVDRNEGWWCSLTIYEFKVSQWLSKLYLYVVQSNHSKIHSGIISEHINSQAMICRFVQCPIWWYRLFRRVAKCQLYCIVLYWCFNRINRPHSNNANYKILWRCIGTAA